MWNERILGVEKQRKRTREIRQSEYKKKYYIEMFTVRNEEKQQQAKYIQIDGQLTTMSRRDTVCTWCSIMTKRWMHRWFS